MKKRKLMHSNSLWLLTTSVRLIENLLKAIFISFSFQFFWHHTNDIQFNSDCICLLLFLLQEGLQLTHSLSILFLLHSKTISKEKFNLINWFKEFLFRISTHKKKKFFTFSIQFVEWDDDDKKKEERKSFPSMNLYIKHKIKKEESLSF